MKIRIRVPATSANMGAGFDCLGAALSLYNTIIIENSDENTIVERGNSNIRFSPNNMIYRSYKFLFDKAGEQITPVKITQNSKIPVTRGLGSSSACITAGLFAANAMMGEAFTKAEIINFAATLEGHPDNVVPAITGGFAVSVIDDEKVYFKRAAIKKSLKFATFVPSAHLRTENSRSILPNKFSKSDCINNISRTGFFAAAMMSGNYENLQIGVQDKIHQQYRLPLIKNSQDIFDMCYDLGAKAVYLSGAGSAIVALIDASNLEFKAKAISIMAQKKMEYFYLYILNGDNIGIKMDILEK